MIGKKKTVSLNATNPRATFHSNTFKHEVLYMIKVVVVVALIIIVMCNT